MFVFSPDRLFLMTHIAVSLVTGLYPQPLIHLLSIRSTVDLRRDGWGKVSHKNALWSINHVTESEWSLNTMSSHSSPQTPLAGRFISCHGYNVTYIKWCSAHRLARSNAQRRIRRRQLVNHASGLWPLCLAIVSGCTFACAFCTSGFNDLEANS